MACLTVVGSDPMLQVAHAETEAPVDVYKELMIVHPSVVDPFLNGGRSHNGTLDYSSEGLWSLRSLLRFLVIHRTEPQRQAFYASLFEQWLTPQTADNGLTAPARDPELVKSLMLDQFSTLDPATGKRTYDMSKAPFELIGIAYRPDLRAANGSDAGELHFIYKLVGPDGGDQKFTLNVEYKIPTTFYNAQDFAHNFHRLGQLEIGSEDYLKLLERITWYTIPSIFHHLPQLAQIRTNELAFDPDGVWEMREFVANNVGLRRSHLLASSAANTPLASFNNTQVLADYVNQTPVLSQPGTAFMNLLMPETIQLSSGPTPFLDSRSHAGIKWTLPGETIEQRSLAADNLGLLTCNGCHQDNKTSGDIEFYHVSPIVEAGIDGKARLSRFLTESDPSRPDSRPGELNRRKADYLNLLAQPWTPKWITP